MLMMIRETRDALASPAAHEALAADPYWPKWDGPWWRMLLLHEMGLGDEIPASLVERLVVSLDENMCHHFPIRAEDVPPGKDGSRDFPCHCQLGCVYQLLAARGVDVDARLPWIRPWFLGWQLPDGGLNCDEAAYTKAVPRSSFVSTLPALEAVLLGTDRPFTPAEEAFLDRGAAYLIERRLWRSLSRGGAVCDEAWQRLTFPRYYHYDLLRGLTFLVRWSQRRGEPLPHEAVAEAVSAISAQLDPDGQLAPGRRACEGARTLRRDGQGAWVKGEQARTFPLLEQVSAVGVPSEHLTREWREVRAALDGLYGRDVPGRSS